MSWLNNSWQLICTECPQNTYSIGGGVYLNGDTEGWEPGRLPGLTTSCYSNDGGKWLHNYMCTPWEFNDSFIQAGSTGYDEFVAFELFFAEEFMKDGFIEFRYKSDTVMTMMGLLKNGDFKFFIDGILMIDDVDAHNSNWKTHRFDLLKGPHDFTWIYKKFNILDDAKLKAIISHLKIVGIYTSDEKCTVCTEGFFAEIGSN